MADLPPPDLPPPAVELVLTEPAESAPIDETVFFAAPDAPQDMPPDENQSFEEEAPPYTSWFNVPGKIWRLGGKMLESVIGKDDREFVAKTTDPPWNGLAYVNVIDRGGRARRGTAFLIDQRWAITAGHVVHDWDYGADGVAKTITLDVARSGDSTGFSTGADYRVYDLYTRADDVDHDIAILRLQSPAPATSYRFLLRAVPDATLQAKAGSPFNVYGYPDDKGHKMWGASGVIESISPASLRHKIDTCPGESGAPLSYTFKYNSQPYRYVVGVHSSGVGGNKCQTGPTATNSALRFTPAILTWIGQVRGPN